MNGQGQQDVSLLIDRLSVMQATFREGISEFELIKLLQSPPHELFNNTALSDSLMLFKTHFVLFHALYQLRGYWRQQGVGELDIHTTNIILTPIRPASVKGTASAQEVAGDDPLARYYLNWDHFENTHKADVNALLDDFWWRMGTGQQPPVSKQERDDAYRLLGIDPDSAKVYEQCGQTRSKQLKRHYRKALAKAHPDKGGSVADAQAVIQAYRLLSAS